MMPLETGAWDWLRPVAFEQPGRLWLLLLIPAGLLLYVIASRMRGRRGMRFTNTTILGQVLPRQRTWLRHLAVAFSLLSLVTLAIAYAIPQAGDRVPRERATIVVVIDCSLSMQATDVEPDRFTAAKDAAKQFVSELPAGYNVAVVSLSGNSSVRLPPVADVGAAQRAIDVLELSESTAIGDAILASLDAVKLAPRADDGSVAPAAIVLLSDGTNTAGQSPKQAAGQAKQAGVPVYTVAYGTELGYVDLDGKREPVPPDDELMRELARISGGEAFTADSVDSLKSAYESLQSEVGYEVVLTEVTARWAGLGLVLGVLAALSAVMMAARWA